MFLQDTYDCYLKCLLYEYYYVYSNRRCVEHALVHMICRDNNTGHGYFTNIGTKLRLKMGPR